jgi:hypothetical protein
MYRIRDGIGTDSTRKSFRVASQRSVVILAHANAKFVRATFVGSDLTGAGTESGVDAHGAMIAEATVADHTATGVHANGLRRCAFFINHILTQILTTRTGFNDSGTRKRPSGTLSLAVQVEAGGTWTGLALRAGATGSATGACPLQLALSKPGVSRRCEQENRSE